MSITHEDSADAVVDNIDTRRKETLLKTRALRESIFNSANFLSIATDAEGVIQIFNVGAERMLGYTAIEVVDKITPADISDPQEVLIRAEALSVELGTPIAPGFEVLVSKASRGIEDIYELNYIRKDGSRLPAMVSVSTLRDAHDIIIGYLFIGTDNTVRKRAEKRVVASLQEVSDLKTALDEHASVAITTPRGSITYVNDKFCETSKYSRDELLGQDHRLVNSGYHPKEFIGELWTTINRGQVWKGELCNRAKDASIYWADTTIVPFLSIEGKPYQYVSIRADITSRKQAEQALQQKNLELEEANRMKSQFLANMSHELRTPLNSIIGFSEVLKAGLMGEMTAQQRESINNIYGSGSELLLLIDDILDLSRIEAGKMTLDLESVHFPTLLADSVSVIEEMASNRRIRLVTEAAPDLGSVQADQRKVKQLVYNLLSNAVKFTEEGGGVTVHASIVPRARVGQLSGLGPGRTFPFSDNGFAEFLEVSVADSGIGIPPEQLEQLFKPFSQIDGGLGRQFGGTGLGLAMVKHLAELHEGTVAVQSTVGEGSCFTAWLPLRAPQSLTDPASGTQDF
jgi:PAS domain S-box-containing protein